MPTPIEEKEWWNYKDYWFEEKVGHVWVPYANIPKIVEEATRRGIEQGKREAWEKAKSIIENSTAVACGDEEKRNAGMWAVDFFKKVILTRIEAKLSLLSNPQK